MSLLYKTTEREVSINGLLITRSHVLANAVGANQLISLYGCCSTAILTAAVLPVAATPSRLVATPGMDAGVKVTVPSMADVAVEDSALSSVPWVQIVCSAQGGDHA